MRRGEDDIRGDETAAAKEVILVHVRSLVDEQVDLPRPAVSYGVRSSWEEMRRRDSFGHGTDYVAVFSVAVTLVA